MARGGFVALVDGARGFHNAAALLATVIVKGHYRLVMVKGINAFFQIALGLAFLYVPVWWLLMLVFGFDLTGYLGLHPVLPPPD